MYNYANETMVASYDDGVVVRTDTASEDPCYCLKCWENVKNDATPSLSYNEWKIEYQCAHHGLYYNPPSNDTGQLENYYRFMLCTLNHIITHYHKYTSKDNNEKLSAADTRTYPTIRPMSSEAQKKHALYSCAFQIYLLFFDVQKCDCCGRVLINHDDPLLPTNTDFRINNLRNKFHKPCYFSCDGYCKKGQFYLARLLSHMRHNAKNHNNWNPSAVLGTHAPNAPLYDACKKEIPIRNENKISMVYTLSSHNGYGTIPYPHTPTNPFDMSAPPPLPAIITDINILWNYPHKLCKEVTPAEEEAIQQVIHLVSIIRYKNGGISTKGNTSCVWQTSKLKQLLPNITCDCRIIYIHYKAQMNQSANQPTNLKYMHFHRMVIEILLQYFVDTGHELYRDLTIELNHLEQWPTEGNLLEYEGAEEVVEVLLNYDATNYHRSSAQRSADNSTSAYTDTATTTTTDANSAASSTMAATDATDAAAEDIPPDILVADGDEHRLAPLQSNMQLEETLEGLMHIGTETLSSHNDVDVANQAFNIIANNISYHLASNDVPALDLQYKAYQQAATVDQQDILPNGSLVQMGVAPFS